MPKATGKPVWLPPYITDNLNVRVISCNEPIYWKGRFVGIIGIELDYSAMAEEVNRIKLYENGYAFVTNAEKEKQCLLTRYVLGKFIPLMRCNIMPAFYPIICLCN